MQDSRGHLYSRVYVTDRLRRSAMARPRLQPADLLVAVGVVVLLWG